MQSKYIDDWTCDCCGELQSKNNQYFNGVCEVCFVTSLTAKEEKYLSELRINLKKENSLDKVSGCFCNIEVESFYSDTLFCKVTLGTCDDIGSYKDDFMIEVDRKSLTFEYLV